MKLSLFRGGLGFRLRGHADHVPKPTTRRYAPAVNTERDVEKGDSKQRRICFFGHFGSTNIGNESTLFAILFHLRRLLPEAKVVCACTGPETLAQTREIEAVPISGKILKRWEPRKPLIASLRRVAIGLPSEFYRSLQVLRTLRAVDMLIIPGTGLLTDAYGLVWWGPYNLFKWSLIARICHCKVLFVSVGAGPVYSTLGKHFVKSALSLADFRSYRDSSSLEYLERIGIEVNSDRVYPDLVFSLPEAVLPCAGPKKGKRSIVGLGLMAHAGKYLVKPKDSLYKEYLDNLAGFAQWLLAHDYDIRLIIGDVNDTSVSEEFKSLLKASSGAYDEERVVDQPARSMEQLLPQIAEADIVVATRFHNVLFALLLNKPVIAISFHHKCDSLMNQMGLAKYCHDINHMNASRLIEQFQDVERSAEKLRLVIRQRVQQSRKALDEQYSLIFKGA
jgi:polysaccharide pyruvyl transferase WcaK-like protein